MCQKGPYATRIRARGFVIDGACPGHLACWALAASASSTEALHLGLQTSDLLLELQYPFDTGDVEPAVDEGGDLTQARHVTAAVKASAAGAAPRSD